MVIERTVSLTRTGSTDIGEQRLKDDDADWVDFQDAAESDCDRLWARETE
jgi:hypothetical protein